MLLRSADLRGLVVRTDDGKSHKVADLETDPAGIALQRVLVDFSGWVTSHRASVGVGRFAVPDLEDRSWRVSLNEDDIERRETGDDDQRPSVTDRIGSKVIATDGEVGKVMDVVYETDTWRPAYLVVQLGKTLPEDQKVVSVGALEDERWRRGEVRLDVSEAEESARPRACTRTTRSPAPGSRGFSPTTASRADGRQAAPEIPCMARACPVHAPCIGMFRARASPRQGPGTRRSRRHR